MVGNTVYVTVIVAHAGSVSIIQVAVATVTQLITIGLTVPPVTLTWIGHQVVLVYENGLADTVIDLLRFFQSILRVVASIPLPITYGLVPAVAFINQGVLLK
jgi:hypothetical protein